MNSRLTFALSLILTLGGCLSAPPSSPVAANRQDVYFGSTTTAYPEVVAVVRLGRTGAGGLCTGTLISPYVVMTAKHCVFDEGSTRWTAIPASDFLVVVGNDINSASGVTQTSAVYEIRTTPGSNVNNDINNGDDIALVLLPAPFAGVEPREWARAAPSRGQRVTMVGFGRNGGPAPDTGVKYVGHATVQDVRGGLISTAGTSGTCQGDSGGPLLNPGGRVTGITSFGPGDCNNTWSVFTQVAKHAALINNATAWRPPCEPTTEVCDGVDNDCDGVIDPGCTRLGDACAGDLECSGTDASCTSTPAGMVCTRACDPREAIPHCPFGFYCEATGCGTGRCLEGDPGPKAAGESCGGDLECASNHCVDLGAGPVCGRQCGDDAHPCNPGEVCEPGADACGACLPADLSTGPRPFGAPCDADADCESMNCLGADFCTKACATTDECGSGFHCSGGECVRGDLVGPGGSCSAAEDCSSTAPECVSVDGDFICAGPCDTGCAPGFECATTDVGERCVPPGLGLGEACSANTDCRSGICAGVCTILCDDRTCPAGFECEPRGEHSGCFEPAPRSGGCSVEPGAAGAAWAWSAVALGVALWWRRRRS